MKGVRDLVWTEVVDVVGRKHQLSKQTLKALKRREAIKRLE
jgi:hypothetical protein